MPISQEVRQRIVEAFVQKLDHPSACPLCGETGRWIIADHYVNLAMAEELTGNLVVGGPSMPCVPLVCMNCGYTVLLNLLVLGLKDLLPEGSQVLADAEEASRG